MKNDFNLEEPERELALRERIFNLIVLFKSGITMRELEMIFDEPRMRLGYIINRLIEEGKIQKSADTYLLKSKLLTDETLFNPQK
ncbi:MAG: hypothetical protein NTU44_05060 [Bacteroidetes bacterium]|nr:hypothetical protein [Bacteroidota bacterium]